MRNKTKKFNIHYSFYLTVLLNIFFLQTNIQSVYAGDSESSNSSESSDSVSEADKCEDSQGWCSGVKHTCDLQLTKDWCPLSCGVCGGAKEEKCPSKNKCSQLCSITDGKVTCLCREGFRLDKDKTSCVDVNECLQHNVCSDSKKPRCINTEGSYECVALDINKCQPGYNKYYKSEKCCKITETKCGAMLSNSRVGVEENFDLIRQWPWVGFMTVDNDVVCGVALLSSNWVVLAAHCLSGVSDSSKITITLGTSRSTMTPESTDSRIVTRRKIKQVTRHPDFEYPKNNIALLELNEPVNMGQFVQSICLPQGEHVAEGKKCFGLGFDIAVATGGAIERKMTEVPISVTKTSDCNGLVESTSNDLSVLCAGNKINGSDICQGSTGGPLVCQRCSSCEWFVAGITSFGYGCGMDNSFTLFTNIAYYDSWLSKITGIASTKSQMCEGEDTIKSETRPEVPTVLPTTTDPASGRRIPIWENWLEWSGCTATCGGGERERRRNCDSITGLGCIGSNVQVEHCNTKPCFKWGNFGKWSKCDKLCGGGEQTRKRECIGGSPSDCGGDGEETQKCNTFQCRTGKWSRYSKWSPCSVTCGRGVQTSSRTCLAEPCKGSPTKEKPCRKIKCPPSWSEWSEWTTCSATCGTGEQVSTRRCSVPRQSACSGESRRVQSCNTDKCKENTSDDPCLNQTETILGDTCDPKLLNAELCQFWYMLCPKTCCYITQEVLLSKPESWTKWGDWGKCTQPSCGEYGVRWRERKCVDEDTKKELDWCSGVAREKEECQTEDCKKIFECAHLPNTLGDAYCEATKQWCTEHKQYMTENGRCTRTCCEYGNQQGVLPRTQADCTDEENLEHFCRFAFFSCIDDPMYRKICRKSCGLC